MHVDLLCSFGAISVALGPQQQTGAGKLWRILFGVLARQYQPKLDGSVRHLTLLFFCSEVSRKLERVSE